MRKNVILLLAVAVAFILLLAVASPQSIAQSTPDATPTATDSGQTEKGGDGFFTIIFSGGLVGVFFVMVLLALSLTAAYLVFEHIMTLRRGELMPDGLADNIRQQLANGQLSAADQLCRQQPCFLSFVILHGLAEIEGGWTAVEKATEDALAEQSARLFRKIEYLSVIGNIAPMIGLLGTVVGMISAFQQVAAGSGSGSELAEGIYQALVTTVGGLIVAIPALGAFAIFRNRVDELVAEAAYAAQHILTPLKRRRSAKSAQASSGPTPPPAPPATGGR